MPAIRSLAISFGLVTVPVAVVTATESHNVNFRRIHLPDNGRVRNRYICEAENREVMYQEIGQGYEMPDGRIIPITDEDLENLPLPTAKAIELVAFMPTASIDPIRIGRGYYLQPRGEVAARPYVLLREALERQSKVGVAKFALSGRERLGLLRVRGDAIVLHSMLWPDEIRDPSEVAPPLAKVTDAEIDGAMALVDTMAIDSLEAAEFRDTYTDALNEVIAAKQEHRELPEAPQPAQPGRLVDLMATLRESVAKAQAARGEDAEVKVKKQPAKKAKARKALGDRPRSV
ncbi:non-homologous end joining protein Ku [Streptomyces chartreusis]